MIIKIISEKRTTDVTELVISAKWSGDYQQAARCLKFSVLASSEDKSIPVVDCPLGSGVQLFESGKLLFDGFILTRSKGTGGHELTLTCYDRGFYLKRNQATYRFKEQTAEQIIAAVASIAIIKAGQGMRQFGTFRDKYLPGTLAAGLDWSAYWWSDAVTVAEAKDEARNFVKALEGLKPTFPVCMDQEYNSPPARLGSGAKARQLRTDMVKGFLDVLQEAGYYSGLYSSTDWLQNWVYDDQLKGYDKWVAQYASRCTYQGVYDMWQHHGDVPGFVGRIDGISVPVDINDCYKDYPGMIKGAGLNGWKSATESPVPPTEKPQEELELFKDVVGKL